MCGKEGKKLQQFQYLENEKRFFDEIKTFFIVFEGLSFGEKIKFDKNSGHKLSRKMFSYLHVMKFWV